MKATGKSTDKFFATFFLYHTFKTKFFNSLKNSETKFAKYFSLKLNFVFFTHRHPLPPTGPPSNPNQKKISKLLNMPGAPPTFCKSWKLLLLGGLVIRSVYKVHFVANIKRLILDSASHLLTYVSWCSSTNMRKKIIKF